MRFTIFHKRLFKRFLFLLIPYSILRIGFYLYHSNIYKQFDQREIFTSLLLGIRFDVAAIIILNLFIIILALIPSEKSQFLKVERIIFSVMNTIGFIMALNDYELFLFMGKRLSFDIFAMSDDILQQLPQITLHYWYFPLAALALGVSVYFTDKSLFPLRSSVSRRSEVLFGGILVLALTALGIRGGLQHKSINIQSAFVQGKNELGHLVLNSPYHFFRTLKNKRVERLQYFASDDEARKIILKMRDLRPGFIQKKKYNVVLLILESFSLEYVEKGYAPFLTRLMGESLSFDRHLANGRRSIEVLPSVLCGLPSLIDEPISKSVFSGNKFNCLPRIIKEAGYTNYFFHGGSRGTMGFEAYTLSIGFDKYFSRDDYGSQDFDGTWGIYDGPYLKFAADKINEMPKPFFAGIFTLSSHQPYAVPKGIKFPKGTLEIHESIGYTDSAVKDFFEKIKNETWFKDTVFILTADHTQKLESGKFENLVGHYRVPFLIYIPGQKLPLIKNKVTQHSDIPPTVLDMVGLNSNQLPKLGASVFSADKGLAINYADGTRYFLVQDENVYTLDKSGKAQLMQIDWDSGKLSEAVPSEDLKLRAFLQYTINGLINNNLSL